MFETIHACGLDSYYRLRDAADATLKPANPTDDSFESFDSAAFEKLYITREADGSASTDLVLEGVTCAACVWLVERLPRVIDGVIQARLSLREATVRITWNPAEVSLSRIARTLDHFGYTPHAAKGQSRKAFLQRDERRRLIHLGVAGAIMGNTMLLALALYAGDRAGMESQYQTFFRWLSAILGTLSLTWPGAIFFRSAYAAVRTRCLNLDVPIALALLVGGVAGTVNVILNRGDVYFDSLSVLVFLLLVGRWMQYRQQRKADGAVELLFSLTPSTVHIVAGDRVNDVPCEALAPGDLVEVRSGELIPADGVVETGGSSVNQALLTGEALPVSVATGSPVHAGAHNIGSTLRVRVEEVGQATRVGKLMQLVERGVREKPAIVQFADRVGAIFTLVVSLAAAGTFLYWSRFGVPGAIDHAVALLIVTCPCVLGLATPLTIALAIGRLARRDILVKSGAALEKLSRRGELLLDKTGTLTEGNLKLLAWHGDESVRPVVAAIERHSTHPIARAMAASAGGADSDADLQNITEKNDGGISADWEGERIHVGSPGYCERHAIGIPEHFQQLRERYSEATVVLVARNQRAVALAVLGDQIRPDSRDSIATLEELGWRPSILSGDAQGVVNCVAEQLAIPGDRAHGQVSPEEKLARLTLGQSAIRNPQSAIRVMAGDGVNDAAALAAADVGIAVHGGAEASLAAADIYVARRGLSPLVELVQTSRHAMRVIRRNLLVSLSYNLLAGVLAAMGIMTPLLAAIIMPVSSATVLSLAAASMGLSRGSNQRTGATWK